MSFKGWRFRSRACYTRKRERNVCDDKFRPRECSWGSCAKCKFRNKTGRIAARLLGPMRNIGAEGFEARDTGHRRALAQSENILEFLAATPFLPSSPSFPSFTLHLKKAGTLSVSVPRIRTW